MKEPSYLRNELKELADNFFNELVNLTVDEINVHIDELLCDYEIENKSYREIIEEVLPEDFLDEIWLNKTKEYLIKSFIPDMIYLERIILKIVSIKTKEIDCLMKEWKDSIADNP